LIHKHKILLYQGQANWIRNLNLTTSVTVIWIFKMENQFHTSWSTQATTMSGF